jgi:hypothetical protein
LENDNFNAEHDGDDVFGDGRDATPGSITVNYLACFSDRVVVEGRENGFTKCWVLELEPVVYPVGTTKTSREPKVISCTPVKFPDDACSCELGDNLEFDSPLVSLKM